MTNTNTSTSTEEYKEAADSLIEAEPECEEEEHKWETSYELFGGCESNPGVFGHGGGVIINEVCRKCGCKRTTNTWASHPISGEQGYESVKYEQNFIEVEEEEED